MGVLCIFSLPSREMAFEADMKPFRKATLSGRFTANTVVEIRDQRRDGPQEAVVISLRVLHLSCISLIRKLFVPDNLNRGIQNSQIIMRDIHCTERGSCFNLSAGCKILNITKFALLPPRPSSVLIYLNLKPRGELEVTIFHGSI